MAPTDNPTFCRKRRLSVMALVLAGAQAVVHTPAFAQKDYPSRPIEMIVPYVAGGTSDLVGRIVAKSLSEQLKTAVVVVNRPGVTGTLGMKAVAAAAPDGYTIGVGGTTNLAIAPYVVPNKPYDPIRAFTPLGVIATATFIVVVRPDSPYKTLNDLIAAGKKKPGALNFGSSGTGGSHHLTTELLTRAAGFSATHIPFKGGAENITNLLSGTVDFMCESSSSIMGQILGGKVRALAVTSAHRLPELPNVPTVTELGVKGVQVETAIGLVAPAGLPRDVETKLNQAINAAMSDKGTRELITKTGSGLPPVGSNDFKERLKADSDYWRKFIAESHIALN